MMGVHEDTLRGLKEALEYVNGDLTKGRSHIVTIPDEEAEMNQILFQRFSELSKSNKRKTMEYVNELLQASNG